MIEVEIKLPLKDYQKTEEDLEELGFFPGSYLEETDLYYTADFHDFKKLDEALRVRSRINLSTGKRESLITYKGKKLDQVSMSRQEIETEVGDGEKMNRILTAIGFCPVEWVVKKRQYYLRGDMTACLDRVEDLGDFLELELLVAESGDITEKRRAALLKIEEILKSLGYCLADTTRRSYLSQLQDKRQSRTE